MTQLPLADHPYRPTRPPISARFREFAALLSPTRRPTGEPGANPSLAAAAGPVLVLPGLGRGDGQTRRLRSFLDEAGYRSFGWDLGVCIGPTQRLMDGAAARLRELSRDHGPVNLVGLSMGGLFCRWLAQRHPTAVRQIVTVCSPFRAALDSFYLPLRPLLPLWPGADLIALADGMEGPVPVPCTFLYTVTDGTVAWESCIDPTRPGDCFAITGPHVTMANNPMLRTILLHRLPRQFG